MESIYLNLSIKWLRNLNNYKENLIVLELAKEEIMIDSPLDYAREKLSKTYKIFSDTEEKAVQLYKIDKLIKSIGNKIDVVENALSKFNETERAMLIYKYQCFWKLQDIADACNYSYVYTSILIKKLTYILMKNMFNILLDEDINVHIEQLNNLLDKYKSFSKQEIEAIEYAIEIIEENLINEIL